jgi:serine protease Do
MAIEKLTPELASELGVRSTAGAVVVRIARSAPAYEAGLQSGDVVVGFNGQPVDEPSQLSRLVADAKIGSIATLKVIREGRTIELRVPIVSNARRR